MQAESRLSGRPRIHALSRSRYQHEEISLTSARNYPNNPAFKKNALTDMHWLFPTGKILERGKQKCDLD